MIKKLQASLVSLGKIELFWNASELPIKVIQLYFNRMEFTCVLRIYDVTHIIFNGVNAHHFFEIAVPYHRGFWSIKGLDSNRNYIFELGVRFSGNENFPLIRSNCIYNSAENTATKNEGYMDTTRIREKLSLEWEDRVSTYSYYGGSTSGGGHQ
jgi:uncharacterized protein